MPALACSRRARPMCTLPVSWPFEAGPERGHVSSLPACRRAAQHVDELSPLASSRFMPRTYRLDVVEALWVHAAQVLAHHEQLLRAVAPRPWRLGALADRRAVA